MNTLKPREFRSVDGFYQHCRAVAHKPDAEYRHITAQACAAKCAWALGLLSLYTVFTLLARIV
jgi:hypothetical protein